MTASRSTLYLGIEDGLLSTLFSLWQSHRLQMLEMEGFISAFFQFEPNRTSLVEPPNKNIPWGNDVTHAACWSVWRRVVGFSQIAAQWQRFCIKLGDLQPFLADTPFPVSPGFIDTGVDSNLENEIDKSCPIVSILAYSLLSQTK